MPDDAKVQDSAQAPDQKSDQAEKPPGQNQPDQNQSSNQAKNQPEQQPPPPPKRPLAYRARRYVRRHPARVLLGVVALVLVAIGSVVLWMYLSSYESTDDAQVDGHLNLISPRIAGTVVGVYVEDNYFVKPGQVLVDLDPRDYKVALAQATGAYQQAGAALRAENPNVPIVVTTTKSTISTGEADVIVAEKAVSAAQQELEAKLADLRNTEAQNTKAQRDVERFRPLAAKEEVSKLQFDAVVATALSQSATVDAARAAVEVASRTLDEKRAQLTQARTRL